MNKTKFNSLNWGNFIDILDGSRIGLWILEIDNVTGMNRFYCSDVMLELFGIELKDLSPEKIFEFWYSRIHTGYYAYIEKAIEEICTTNKLIEVEYPWNHPKLGEIIVRCSGQFISSEGGIITIKGYHQNINDLHQMKVVLSKTENKIFEWYTENNTAYIHNQGNKLFNTELTIGNFPMVWSENGYVHKDFKDIYLKAFEKINNGSEKSICEIKMKDKNEGYSWFKLTLSKEKISLNKCTVLGTIEDINNLKKLEIDYVIESKFYKASIKDMLAYAEVNISKDKILSLNGEWAINNNDLEKLNIASILKRDVSNVMLFEDIETFTNILDKDNLLNCYNNGESTIKHKFKIVTKDEKIKLVELTVTLFQEPYEKDILALIYLKVIENINEQSYILEDNLDKKNKSNEQLKKYTKYFDTTKNNNYLSIDNVLLNELDGLVIYIIDEDTYELIDGSNSFFRLINKSKEESISKKCYNILHNRRLPCISCKKEFCKTEGFYIWTQFNNMLKKDFLIKNKVVTINNRKCIFSIAIDISKINNAIKNNVDERPNKTIFDTISYLLKRNGLKENISVILDLMSHFYKSKAQFIFRTNIEILGAEAIDNISDKDLNIKNGLKDIVINDLVPSHIDNITYLNSEKEAIAISYNLYIFMKKYSFYNILIVPIFNLKDIIAYAIFIDNDNIENIIEYNNLQEYTDNMSYLISEEFIKNSLKINLDLEKYYDSLTGVLNRNAYRDYEKHYDSDKINTIGVLCLALNELNNINYTAGVMAGDQLLLNLADILKKQFENKYVFRLSGNEFLIVRQDISYDGFLKEIDILNKNLEQSGLSMTYGKVWSSEEKELNYLVNSAIYFRKSENEKNNEIVKNNFSKRNTLLSQLMLSIESGEYTIFLQPKFNLDNDVLNGAEALIRKKNKEGGFIPPDKFIPTLEHYYLIHYIDLFVFEEVFKLLQNLKNEGKELIPISLNFSRRTLLEDDIIKQVLDIKNKYNVDPSYIEIEVTESIGDLEKQAICKTLKEIENIGINILLDDFGVKYSNLTILSEVKFYGLKLDKSMVRNLGENNTNDIIMKNIIAMCKDLKINTIAEGIETVEQRDILKSIKCDIAQGYLYSKPLPVNEFLDKYYKK